MTRSGEELALSRLPEDENEEGHAYCAWPEMDAGPDQPECEGPDQRECHVIEEEVEHPQYLVDDLISALLQLLPFSLFGTYTFLGAMPLVVFDRCAGVLAEPVFPRDAFESSIPVVHVLLPQKNISENILYFGLPVNKEEEVKIVYVSSLI